MAHMTLTISDELAERLRPLGVWLPTALELTLVGYKTVAAATATEVLEFLAQGPSPEEVLAYQASARAQDRLQRLLALNAAGLLGEDEQQELDELQQIEHIIIMLKAHLARPPEPESYWQRPCLAGCVKQSQNVRRIAASIAGYHRSSHSMRTSLITLCRINTG